MCTEAIIYQRDFVKHSMVGVGLSYPSQDFGKVLSIGRVFGTVLNNVAGVCLFIHLDGCRYYGLLRGLKLR